jgi:hypothetical protein
LHSLAFVQPLIRAPVEPLPDGGRQRLGLGNAGHLSAFFPPTQGVASPIFAGPSIFIHWRT